MNNQIIIAVDAMGGDNSPNKVIEGVSNIQRLLMMFITKYLGIQINNSTR